MRYPFSIHDAILASALAELSPSAMGTRTPPVLTASAVDLATASGYGFCEADPALKIGMPLAFAAAITVLRLGNPLLVLAVTIPRGPSGSPTDGLSNSPKPASNAW
jgi:hypothetical protein